MVSRILLPTAPLPRERPPFPVIATVAPVVVGVAMVVITGSIVSLAFAALGPVIAVASLLDGRRSSRRSERHAVVQFARDVERVRAAIDHAHDAERVDLELQNPDGVVHVQWDDPPELTVRIGTGDVPSGLSLEGDSAAVLDDLTKDIDALKALAAVVRRAPIVQRVEGAITLVGPATLTRPLLRSLIVQIAARLSPVTHSVAVCSASEAWLVALPHRVTEDAEHAVEFRDGERLVASFDVASDAVGVRGPIIAASALGSGAQISQMVLQALSVEQARDWALNARDLAVRRGIHGAMEALPDSVSFASLDHSPVGLSAPLGCGESGAHDIDLIAHGPHAVVGGTTGSGKSELLVTWLLGVAAHRSPAVVTFLLFDFKGGSSFGSLPTLPHCVGLVTDLDAAAARRALESIGAELRYRERVIAERGVKAIDDVEPGTLSRLIVVVDEFASVAETFPELYAVFADLAARGRSLGVHLVLCTQRPAGVVRDSVMANIGLRISLRVTNASDSTAVLGTDAAARLVGQPVGRACIAQIGHAVKTIQVALATDQDVVEVAQRWSSCEPPRRPWLDPLPAVLTLPMLPSLPGTRVFGLTDDPGNQAQPPATWVPASDGSLAVVGGTASGKSTALAAIAMAGPSLWVPAEHDGAWDAVAGAPEGVTVIIDDLDRLLGRLGAEYEREIVDRLVAIARDPLRRVVVAAQRLTGGAAVIAAECEARLVLRMANRADHILAGGAAADFDSAARAGAGSWRGRRVQVVRAELVHPARPTVPAVIGVSELTIGVSSRPRQLASMLKVRGIRVEDLDQFRADDASARVVVADSDSWQSAYATLASLRARCPILFHASTLAEVRTIARIRELPPPLTDPTTAGWLVDSGEVRRVTF